MMTASRFLPGGGQNHNAGAARNLGMSHATGEYLVFWDCDDYFDRKALEKLYERAKQTDADVVVCGANQYLSDKHQTYPHNACLNIKQVPDVETFNRFSNPKYYLTFTNATAWNKFFLHSYIKKQGLQFQEIRNGNDVYFTVNAIGLADKIAIVNEKLVTYRNHQDTGLINSVAKSPLSPIQAWIETAENLEKHDGFGIQSFANKAVGSMIYLLCILRDWEAFRQAVEALKSYGLERMHIFPREDYYYNKFHEECINHLYHDTVEQFSLYMMHHYYINLDEANADRARLNMKQKTLQSDAKKQQDKCKNLENERKSLEAENQKWHEENQGLSEIIQNLDEEIQSLNEKNQKLIEKSQRQTERITRLKSKNQKLTKENEEIRNSTTFRVGQAVTWLPKKIKNMGKHMR